MDIPSAIATNLPRAMGALRSGIRRDRANAYALLEPWTLPPLGGDLPGLGLMPPAPYADERLRVWFGTTEGTEHTEGAEGGTTKDTKYTKGAEGAWRVTVLPWQGLDGAECDGCTLAPDTWGDLRLYVGALYHDRWYLSMESIAKAWGWPVARVRRLGDIVFASVLRDQARGLPGLSRVRGLVAARLYYAAARAFGGVAHAAMRKTSSPGGGGGISPNVLSAPVVLAGLLLFAAGCTGGCRLPNAWDDTVGLYRIEEPAVAHTNTVTGAHFVTGGAE